MASGKQVGEFSLKASTLTFTPGPAGSVLVHVNLEGPATNFGTVLGTMTAVSAGQKSGTWSWCAVGYLDNGDNVTGNGQGTFNASGPNRWSTQGSILISDGRNIAVEGEMDLATRVWSGKLFDRS